MQVSRRGLVAGAALGGGLIVAWWLLPRSYPNPLEPAEGEHAFDAWLKIAEDGVVTVAVPQLEMGQGISTLLPQIIAQELGADWRQIAVEPGAVSGAYPNIPLAERWSHLWDPLTSDLSEASDEFLAERFASNSRFTATADGTSLAAYEMPCRRAAAAARAMLAQEAASLWDVQWEQCVVSRGLVSYGEKRATFGELAAGAAIQSPPDPPPLRPEVLDQDETGSIDNSDIAYPRIDLPSKVDGTFQFAGDVRLPGLVYASIRHGPIDGSELTEFDAAEAAGIAGVVGAVKGKRWLAVAANTWWDANRALDAMNPQFKTSFPVNGDDISGRLDTMVEGGPSFRIAETGFGEEAMTRVDFARRYEVEPAMAAPLETATATARLRDGRLELWMASQAPEQARSAAAKAIGLSPEDVALYPIPAGGSFDARLEHDHAIEIALIARELGKPVQLSWPRRDEILRARPRPPAYMLLGAQLTQGGSGLIVLEGQAKRTRIASIK
ncbi:MAG: molybdopterin cofactor-binding domain-containing protein, partial [Pseudomonadota bacterium]